MAKEYIERKALLQDIDETVLFSNKTGKRNPDRKCRFRPPARSDCPHSG